MTKQIIETAINLELLKKFGIELNWLAEKMGVPASSLRYNLRAVTKDTTLREQALETLKGEFEGFVKLLDKIKP